MNQREQEIIQLAEAYENPDEFICEVEKLLSHHEKADFLFQVGIVLNKYSYFHLALHLWNYAIEYFTEKGDKFKESKCCLNLGIAHDSLGDSEKAVVYYKKSLKIAKEVRDRSLESECYINFGIAYNKWGYFKKAISYYKKSLKIAQEVGDKALESKCYGNIGIAHYSSGSLRESITYYEKSLDTAKEIGDKNLESKIYGNIGNSYSFLGNFKKGIEYYEKSLDIAEKVGDRFLRSQIYMNLGSTYRNLGNFQKAIEYHEKSLKIVKEIGNKSSESTYYMAFGIIYEYLGNFQKAIEYHKKSIKIAQEIGDKPGVSECYSSLGSIYHNLGDFKKSIGYYEKSLKIAREIGDKTRESDSYTGLGTVYHSLGDLEKALEYHKESLKIAQEIGDKIEELGCYIGLGTVYHSLGDLEKALEYHKKSLKIAQEIGDTNSERIVNLNLARMYSESKPEIAYSHCKRSIDLSEMISGTLVEEEHKIMFSSRTSDAYQLVIPLCLKIRKEKEALEYIERSKSRAFLDMLAATEIKPTRKITGTLQSLLNDEEMLLDKLREMQTRHLRPVKPPAEPGEVEKIYHNMGLIYDKIEKYDPEYVFTRRRKPLPFDKIQDMISLQKRDVVLIEYFITKDNTFIFVISSKDSGLHIKTVPLSMEKPIQYVEKSIRYIENYWRELAQYPHFRDIDDIWLKLNAHIIEPVSEYLTEGDLIYFVPYGSLHYVPLHALELDGEPLIKRHPVVYSPSASLIQFCQNKGSGTLQSCASFGVEFEEEAESVAALFGTTAHRGKSATKDNVLNSCSKDIIHFACHGYFSDEDPLSSGVRLFDGILTAKEIFDMRLDTELVTLSGCQTGLNQRSPGDELIGLTRAFLYAGAPSVIVSLWSVYSPSTQELMHEFYKQLKNGRDKATALQRAQIEIMEREEYSDPYYWAPFILIGDWK